MSRPFVRVLTIALGIAVLAAIRVSTVPDDLLFMLPATAVLWGSVFAALRERPASSRLPLWISVPCWLWLGLLALNPVVSAWPEASIWFAVLFALIPASILGLSRLLADDRVWDRLEWLIFGSAGLVAAMMLYQYFVQGLRANGPFLDANVASAAIYAALLPLFYRLVLARDSGAARWALKILALGLSTALFTSFSRGGVGSFEIALAGTAIVLLLARSRLMAWRFGGCLAIVAVAWALVYHGPMTPHTRSLDNISQDHSFAMRLVMWDAALDIHDDAPLTGTGLGTFSLTYPQYRPLIESGTVGDMAHDDYLQMLAEGGPLLAAFLLAFVLCVLGSALWRLWCLRGIPSGAEKAATVRDMGLFAALLAFAVHATVNFIFYILLLSLLSGLYAARLAGRYAVTERAVPAPQITSALRQVARPFCGLAALLSLIVIGTGFVSMSYLHPSEAGDKVSMRNPQYHLALALSHINPLDFRAHFYVAHAEAGLALELGPGNLGVGMAVQALKDLDNILVIKHRDCSTQSIKGRILSTFRSHADTLREADLWQNPVLLLRHVNKVLPTCMPAYMTLARHWEDEGDLDKAFRALAPAFPWLRMAVVEIDAHARVLTNMADIQAKRGKREQALALLNEAVHGAPDYQPARDLQARIRDGQIRGSPEKLSDREKN